jgi:hypothetical protein
MAEAVSATDPQSGRPPDALLYPDMMWISGGTFGLG